MNRILRTGVITLFLVVFTMMPPNVHRNSVTLAQDDSLCRVLQKYVKSAEKNFTSEKGPQIDQDEYGTSYRAKDDVPGFTNCKIDFVKDIGEPSLVCKSPDGDVEQVFNKVRPCFQTWNAEHKSTSSADQYVLTGPTEVRVRVRKSSETTKLWIDAPSRD